MLLCLLVGRLNALVHEVRRRLPLARRGLRLGSLIVWVHRTERVPLVGSDFVHVQSLGVCVTVRVDLVQQQVLLSLNAVHQLRHHVLHRGGRGRPARAFVCVMEMVVMCVEISSEFRISVDRLIQRIGQADASKS